MSGSDPPQTDADDEYGSADAPEQAAIRLIEAGNLIEDSGRPIDALECYDAALRLAPGLARAHLNRGNALQGSGDNAEALRAYTAAIALEPDYAGAYFNMGNCLLGLGRTHEAVAAFRSAIVRNPALPGVHTAIGVAYDSLGQTTDAVASYRLSVQADPNDLEASRRLGRALAKLGQHEDAVATFRHALALDPTSAELHNDLGISEQQLGRFDQATGSYLNALRLNPEFAEAHSNYGAIRQKCGNVDEAIEHQQRAISIKPGLAEAHSNLASALKAMGRFGEALASYRRALELSPDFAHAHVGLGDAFKDLGRSEEAVHCFRRALQIDASLVEAYTSLLFCLSHDEAVEADALYAEHRRFGEHFEGPLRAGWPVHANVADPGRCLQVGLVSGDFRAHPMAHFIEPLLVQLARRSSLSLHVYNNHAVDDHVTERLRGQVQNWHRVAGLSDEALARLVMQHRIDVLIDLSGHTSENRLLTFARKPAPIQASWIGYLGTTGLRAMDYYFADRHLFPLDPFAGQFTEKLVHLPASAPFLPDADAPPVNALPALSSGHITFGSFNHPRKVRAPVIALWAQLLRALPRAQLLLGALPPDGQQEQLLELFAHEGIARERIGLHARCPTAEYLRLHHRVDICLDTFPYAGGATNAHALWMGVPTLTMAGRTPVGRLGAALMSQVGLDDYVAQDAADYVRKGVALAADLPALARTRTELRARCAQTPSRQPEVIAAGFERALRIMWERWCQGLPASEFEVSGW